jgi:hypothetical protein
MSRGKWLVLVAVLSFATNAYPADPPRIKIVPEALVGCRSPEEPGCKTCRLVRGTSCVQKYWTEWPDQKPWYNGESVSCITSSPACASCSRLAESALRERLASSQMSCDCARITIDIDPCFAPDSCECHCVRLKGLSRACPYELQQK